MSKIKAKEMTSYLIINNDLNMSKGKIASQVAHGILDVHRFLLFNKINHDYWSKNGEKIVALKADKKTIELLLKEYEESIIKENTFNVFPVYDAGRTEVESGSLTVLACCPVTQDKIPDEIKKLKLL